MAGSCSFRNTDEEVLGQVIFGCRSAKLRRQILEKPDISLTKILQMGRAHEVAELQATEIEGHVKKLQGEEAKFVTAGRRGAQGRRGGGTGRPSWRTEAPSRQWEQHQGDYDSSNDPTNESCGQCGHEPHSEEDCPARGVSCNRCGQRNHYARMCRTGSGRRSGRRGRRGTIRLVTEEGLAGLTVTESGDASEYGADTMGVEHSWAVSEAPWEGAEELTSVVSKAVRCWVTVNGKDAKAIIDTGATTNVMRDSLFRQLCPKVQLRAPTSRLYALGQTAPLKVRGVAEIDIGYGDKVTRSLVYVTSGVTGFLLSKTVSIKLGLIAVLCQPEGRHVAGGKEDNTEPGSRGSAKRTDTGARSTEKAMVMELGGSRDTEQVEEAGNRMEGADKRRRKRRRTKWAWWEFRWSPSRKECQRGVKETAPRTPKGKQEERRRPRARKRRASTLGSQGSESEGRPRARRQRQALGSPGSAIGLDVEDRGARGMERSEKKGEQQGAGLKEGGPGRSRREKKKMRGAGVVKDNKG